VVSLLEKEERQIGERFVDSVMEAIREKVKQEAIRLIVREAAVKIAKYLGMMNKDYAIHKEAGIVVKEKIDKTDTVDIYVIFRPPEWIEIRSLLVKSDEISGEVMRECNVLETLMMLSNDFAELSFCMDKEGNIYAKQNILVGALSFDLFKEEYDAVYISALIFRKEILPKIKKCIKDYEEIRGAYAGII